MHPSREIFTMQFALKNLYFCLFELMPGSYTEALVTLKCHSLLYFCFPKSIAVPNGILRPVLINY